MGNEREAGDTMIIERKVIYSKHLKRDVLIDAYLPLNILNPSQLSLLLINDGQDLVRMPFEEIIKPLISSKTIAPVLCIGIHCSADRKMEYGIASTPDYKGRGAKAGLYTKFIFEELLPYITNTYHLYQFHEKAFAGFSLGGLSALDIVWNHPDEFSRAGIFSGSLWWRNKGYEDGFDEDNHRIMHQQVRNSEHKKGLQFFFECGAMDEALDRNNNGIIDSIDDTIDLIKELTKKGYSRDDITYVELPDGKHDVQTWAKAFPLFLQWGWGK